MRTTPILAVLAAAGALALTACGNAATPSAALPTTAASTTDPGQPAPPTGSVRPPGTAAPTTTAASTTTTSSAPAATRKVVIAPVTARGTAAAGYRTVTEAGAVDCPEGAAAAVSLSRNVHECNPSAAAADVCWASATPRHVLCLRDPWVPTLTELATSTPLAPVGAVAAPQPFGLELSDGDHCRIRNGGAWGHPRSHPTYIGFYSCTKHGAVWGARTGIDMSAPRWIVLVGDGTGALEYQTVVKAYYVRTAG